MLTQNLPRLRDTNPVALTKVVAVAGDITEAALGLTSQDIRYDYQAIMGVLPQIMVAIIRDHNNFGSRSWGYIFIR